MLAVPCSSGWSHHSLNEMTNNLGPPIAILPYLVRDKKLHVPNTSENVPSDVDSFTKFGVVNKFMVQVREGPIILRAPNLGTK